jgi:hypothetical protein
MKVDVAQDMAEEYLPQGSRVILPKEEWQELYRGVRVKISILPIPDGTDDPLTKIRKVLINGVIFEEEA